MPADVKRWLSLKGALRLLPNKSIFDVVLLRVIEPNKNSGKTDGLGVVRRPGDRMFL